MRVIKHALDNVVHLHFEKQYPLCATFLRIQEFYESPFSNIKNNVFKLKDYRETSILHTGVFDYHNQWIGFNVPGNVVFDFFNKFKPLYKKELILYDTVKPYVLTGNDKFYVIGTFGKEDSDDYAVAHEIAHALYYLNPDYKIACTNIYNSMDNSDKEYMTKQIIGMGYHPSVVEDEIQAFLSTNTQQDNIEYFGKYPITLNDVYLQYVENYKLFNNGR